jgi:hypothetical protein
MDLAGTRARSTSQAETLRSEVRGACSPIRRRCAFAEAFPRQWLQLRRVGMFAPDRRSTRLRRLPREEHDRRDHRLLPRGPEPRTSACANSSIPTGPCSTSAWRPITASRGDRRGDAARRAPPGGSSRRPADPGAILSLTSDGTRHRPVHRGKWILESIIGKAGTAAASRPMSRRSRVSAAEPAQAVPARQARAHRENANCAACHRKIDPLGLAFDNYDAIGHWRTEEAVRDGSGANPKIDASGELADGRTFADASGLKNLLVADLDQIRRRLL